jgi:hypothetical protein
MGIAYGPTVTAETVIYDKAGQTLDITYNGTMATMTKVGANGWDTHAYSLLPFTAPCTIEFNKKAAAGDNGLSYTMVGWNADPTTDASYSSIDWASYPFTQNDYYIYNNGAGLSTGIAWDQNKKFYIVYDTDGYIRHYNGSTLLYSANKGTGQTVYFDSSFYSPDPFGSLRNVRIVKRSWNGTCYV